VWWMYNKVSMALTSQMKIVKKFKGGTKHGRTNNYINIM